MAYTISEIIDIAKVSGYLAQNDIAKGSLFGQRKDPLLALKIYMERKAVEWAYGMDTDYDDLRNTANYLYALCGKYAVLAYYIVTSGSGGSSITPGTITGYPYLIPITSADFADATNYNDASIVDKTVRVFWNDIPRFLNAGEFEYTATGINILVEGFDAEANDYTMFIFVQGNVI
jgi:hypothetical protein